MRGHISSPAIAVATTAMAVAAVMPASAMTGGITNGGSVTATSSSFSVTDVTTNKTVTCTSATAGGTLPNTTTPGNPLGNVTTEKFSGCSGGGFTFTSVIVTLPSSGLSIQATVPEPTRMAPPVVSTPTPLAV